MSETPKLHNPWLVAVWPGMGQVALSGGYYLMAKLGMHLLAEFSPRGLFEVDHVEVERGLIHTGTLPRSRFFLWSDPEEHRDIVVFIGEAQPPAGKYAFCHKLIEYAQTLGVERVVTFAAMATQMHPEHDSRVFGAATEQTGLSELHDPQLGVEILQDGHIGGLNGVLLGAAAEVGLPGVCLLGEMPHIFAQLPFPKASLAVLRVFATLSGVTVDLAELQDQSDAAQERLGKLLAQVEQAIERKQGERGELDEEEESYETGRLTAEESAEIERLFEQAARDRSQAYILKQSLDSLGVFEDYEDRFLDLFKK